MRQPLLTLLCLAVCSALLAQPSNSFRKQFVQAHRQRFRVDNTMLLLVNYDGDGNWNAASLTPVSSKSTELPATTAADAVLDVLSPGISNASSGSALLTSSSQNSSLYKNYKGCLLVRQDLSTGDQNQTIHAELTANSKSRCNGVENLRAILTTKYGAPEYEQVLAAGNVDLGLTYTRNGHLTRVDLDPAPSKAADGFTPSPWNTGQVEHLIEEVAPIASLQNIKTGNWNEGGIHHQVLTSDNAVILRDLRNGVLIHAAIDFSETAQPPKN